MIVKPFANPYFPSAESTVALCQLCSRCGQRAVIRLTSLQEGDICYCNSCYVAGTQLLAKAMAEGKQAPRWAFSSPAQAPAETPRAPTEAPKALPARFDYSPFIGRAQRIERGVLLGLIPLLALLIVRNLPGLRDLPWWP